MEEDDDYAREMRLKHLGMELAPTGDPYFDMWEKQLAEGKIPDMEAGEDERILKRDAMVRAAARQHFLETGERRYRAPLPLSIDPDRAYSDPLEFDAEKYLADGEEGYVDSDGLDLADEAVQKLSPDAIDRFWNAAGLIKKE